MTSTLTRPRTTIRIVVGVVALGLVAGACGGAGSKTAPSGATPDRVVKGGVLVLGASQEPLCADWIASCGSSSWGQDMMALQTLPHPFDFVDDHYRPSPLLVGEPTLEVGPPQRVTYRIDPRAVWSDGRPITSGDFRYTFEQTVATTPGTTTVDAVDDSDPSTAIVTFREPTAAWRTAFPFLLPKHLLEGKDRYLQAYKTGQVDMIFVQGAQPEVGELKTLPNTDFQVNEGLTWEFVMFNTQRPPLDSRTVRQALAYATDRDAIVAQLSGPLQPGITPAQGFISPGNRQWYTDPFRRYSRDLAKVAQLMTSDGWAKGADGVWAKGGTHAVIELNSHTGNRRRELAEQILQSQWREAGFETTVNNGPAATVNNDWVPKGNFQAAIYGMAPPTNDPNRCAIFCSKNIPTEANRFQGGDVSRISSKAIDEAWEGVQRELDDAKRVELHRRAQELLAEEVPTLPLSPVLDIVVSNSAKVGGPVRADGARIFSRLNEWFCKACG